MSDNEGRDNTTEEPQSERGAPGSRDEGSMDGGPADRPAGDPHSDDDTAVDSQDTTTAGADSMPTGDGGG